MHVFDAEMGSAAVVFSLIFFLNYFFENFIGSFLFCSLPCPDLPVVKFMGRRLVIVCLLKS